MLFVFYDVCFLISATKVNIFPYITNRYSLKKVNRLNYMKSPV